MESTKSITLSDLQITPGSVIFCGYRNNTDRDCISKDLTRLVTSPKYSDIGFILEKSEKVLYAHRIVLSRCPCILSVKYYIANDVKIFMGL
jgi:hypothetical protein